MKVRRTINGWMVCVMLGGITSCYYDNAEDLYPSKPCVTDNMSLQNNIQPILERNCYVCHSAAANNGNVTLEGYNQLIQYVNSGKLLGAIRHQSGFSPMPQNASRLIDCDIAKIEKWIEDGAPNN